MDNKLIRLPEKKEHDRTENSLKPPCHRVIIENEKWKLCENDYLPDIQHQIFIEGDNTNKMYKKMQQEIKRKINSYKSQDKLKNIYDNEKFIDYDTIREHLLKCEFKCFYCKDFVKILYQYVRESKQWSVERIDNDYGHNKDNITIACLHCNLHRRTMYHERFVFTKQLNIVKTDI